MIYILIGLFIIDSSCGRESNFQPPLEQAIKLPENISVIDAGEFILRQRMKLFNSISVQSSMGEPWPMPQVMHRGSSNLSVLSDQFNFVTLSECDTLKQAINRYHALIFGSVGSSDSISNDIPPFKTLNIELDGCETYPSMNMNENYTLSIWPNGTGLLKAAEVWGALRGLETLSQLFFSSDGSHWFIKTVEIIDYPRFSYRGILLDTSRHYISVSNILKNLDLMAYNKFNVFHWHIVDDHSFPYVSERFPDLSAKGSFSPKHVYNRDDVKKIVEYARVRGIRVIPEFDTPGHTLSWGAGQTKLLTPCYGKDGKPDGTFGPIDPSFDGNFDFLTSFFDEVFQSFPDLYVHLGGDEVSFDCWSSNPNIKQFMELQNFGTDFAKLEQYYIQQLMKYVGRGRNKTSYIVWQEVFDNGIKLNNDSVVHVWMGNEPKDYWEELSRVTANNLPAVLSSCWYLNYIAYGSDWVKHYQCEPTGFNGTQEQKSLVMGGEACLWGEYVDNTVVIPRLWPRASAVAERLWSDASVNDYEKATKRLEEHRCRLIRRGYQVEPVNGPGYCPFEWPN